MSEDSGEKQTPGLSMESYENKLIALSMRQAEEELSEKRASSQVMTHFLRLGTIKAQVELEALRLQNALLEEKIKTEQTGRDIESLFERALDAFKSYRFSSSHIDDGYDDYDDYT